MNLQWLPKIDFPTTINFNITTVIDLLIVAFVMYRVFLLIKGTRAVQLIKGLIVILVGTVVSDWLHLYTFNWILRQAMTALVVALPIVFQPELRRALEKLGGGKFFAGSVFMLEEEEKNTMVIEVVRATQMLAKNSIGALIVMERGTGLEEYIDTGTKIDGKISAELLVNIFIPKTPLHDGAVVVRGDRILAAGCVLPLDESPHVSKALGTRHRAGLGITAQSDSVAVIVSEETGVVSLAVEGVLTRYLDEASLTEHLNNVLGTKTTIGLSSLWRWR
ncbi:diadenylate cyclase CdaA [Desulfolucanica intricata]|uniref:diadenylate cyclase CdaA n=1 Tax=Desulfolucanica intricata TaxID=1285191 RepID=UPI0009EE395A|nr:diadenylate cyclase CdaA [Desulfolucanica intricata]